MMKLFGTDGIRAKAGSRPLDADTVRRVGAALVRVLASNGTTPRLLIGSDTRESCDWIEEELTRGVSSAGATLVVSSERGRSPQQPAI